MSNYIHSLTYDLSRRCIKGKHEANDRLYANIYNKLTNYQQLHHIFPNNLQRGRHYRESAVL